MYYVTMTDKFMSGWGKAEGKTNKVVLECDTYQEAQVVAENARNRGDMNYINIRATKPYYNNNYYVSYHDKTTYTEWYTPNYFRK